MEDPDLAKQNDRDAAASPFADLPTKLLKQGFDVPPRQAAAYRSGEDQLEGSLVLPLHCTMVLPPGTSGGHLSTVCCIRITLEISGAGTASAGLTCYALLQLSFKRQQLFRLYYNSEIIWDASNSDRFLLCCHWNSQNITLHSVLWSSIQNP